MSCLYGPVASWRLGRSLGVDAVSTPQKTCSFDCVYCQLGRTVNPLTERRVFITPALLAAEARKYRSVSADTVTFSGVAEPTLAANLAELVAVTREHFPQVPVAILTNASLLPEAQTRRDLCCFDIVVAKLDAPNEALFRQINRPFTSVRLEEIVEALGMLRQEFRGRLALQIMFIEENRHFADLLADIARRIEPDEVQLNTPLRRCPREPLSVEAMAEIEQAFAGLPVRNVYSSARPETMPLDIEETRRRRPESQ